MRLLRTMAWCGQPTHLKDFEKMGTAAFKICCVSASSSAMNSRSPCGLQGGALIWKRFLSGNCYPMCAMTCKLKPNPLPQKHLVKSEIFPCPLTPPQKQLPHAVTRRDGTVSGFLFSRANLHSVAYWVKGLLKMIKRSHWEDSTSVPLLHM